MSGMKCDICGRKHTGKDPKDSWLLGADGLLYCPECRTSPPPSKDVLTRGFHWEFLQKLKLAFSVDKIIYVIVNMLIVAAIFAALIIFDYIINTLIP